MGRPKVKISAIPSNKVNITDKVTFYANASGIGMENFIYQWIHNDRIVSEGLHKSKYTVTQVKKHHNGYYRCNVSNPYNDTKSSNVVNLKVLSTYARKPVLYYVTIVIMCMNNS